MKRCIQALSGLLIMGCLCSVSAQTIVFRNNGLETSTTGELIDGATNVVRTIDVPEVPGLRLSANSSNERHRINTTVDSLGINDLTTTTNEVTDRFDDGEVMTLSFDKKLTIRKFDFIGINSNSLFVVDISGMPAVEIAYTNLNNKTSQVLETNIVVEAGTEIDFYVGNTNSVVGLQAIDVELFDVVDTNAPTLSICYTNNAMTLSAVFSDVATTNYVLQYREDLSESNEWVSITASFVSDTNWIFASSNATGFYRAIAE